MTRNVYRKGREEKEGKEGRANEKIFDKGKEKQEIGRRNKQNNMTIAKEIC